MPEDILSDGGGSGDGAGTAGAGSAASGTQDGGSGGGTGTNGGTKERPSFMDGFPDAYKNDERFYGYESTADMLKSHVELMGLKGGVTVPGEGADEAAIAAYRKAIGVPEKPEDYELPQVELPQGMQRNDAMTAAFLKDAHELGMPPHMVKELFARDTKRRIEDRQNILKNIEDDHNKAVSTLQEKWPGEQYDKNVGIAVAAVKHLIGPEGLKYLQDEGMASDPVLVEAFHAVGTKVLDDKALSGQTAGSSGDNQPRDASGRKMLRYKGLNA
jgi:hypothetical protein